MKMDTRLLDEKNEQDIKEAGKILRRGGLVAIPTETVYGLAGNALDPTVSAQIYKVKGRPSDNPLIVHIADIKELPALVEEIPEAAKKLADAFWPGPLTIIMKKSPLVPMQTTGGLDTVAVRMPSDPTARAIINAAGVPLAAPSANLSGLPSPTSFPHVCDDLMGRVDGIVNGGDCEVGVESTVITVVTEIPRVLRPGGISVEQLRRVLGRVDVDRAVLEKPAENAKVASPGMKSSTTRRKRTSTWWTLPPKTTPRFCIRTPKQLHFALTKTCRTSKTGACPTAAPQIPFRRRTGFSRRSITSMRSAQRPFTPVCRAKAA